MINEKKGSEGNFLLRYLNSKKGVSPVVATVLLVVIVIVIGLIIFLWFRSFMGEVPTKFGGTNIEIVCEDVEFSVQYSSVTKVLSIVNTGNVPIYDINLRITQGRSHETISIGEVSETWPVIGLRQGGSFSGSLGDEIEGDVDKVLAIPVLMGTVDGKERSHICEDRHGREIII